MVASGVLPLHAQSARESDSTLLVLTHKLESSWALGRDAFRDSVLQWGEMEESLYDLDELAFFGCAVDLAHGRQDHWLEAEMLRELSSPYRHLDSIALSFDCLHRAIDIAEQHDSTLLGRLHHKLAWNYIY